MTDYEEFAFLDDIVAQRGLDSRARHVQRVFVSIESTRKLSALIWGERSPELVMFHGGAQNAHTFDAVALALNLPLVALDLPHHGHSDGSTFGRFAVLEHARDLSLALRKLITPPLPLVAMSYGGRVGIALSYLYPDLVSQLFLIDITPRGEVTKNSHVQDFINGPGSFATFDEILARTIAFNPTRSEASLRQGVLHNAVQRPDGSWVWRHQQHGPGLKAPAPTPDLWSWLEELPIPVTLIRAMGPSSIVSDANIEDFTTRRPHDEIIEVVDASHSVQGSHPLELAELLRSRI